MQRASFHVGSTLLIAIALGAAPATSTEIDFQRDIRPLLSSYCFQCHGPDADHRQADLRLDTQEGVLGAIAGQGVVVAGDAANSPLMQRILSDDPDQRMPPPDSDKELTSQQKELIQQWIEQGATWRQHWAFAEPVLPAVPDPGAEADWIAHPIDAFVNARLKAAGLTPAEPASPATLVRRMHLDLIGLPPEPHRVQWCLDDPSDENYRKLIEQLLDSPHHGEKWARHWLDAARYADSDGFEKDKPRDVWVYRDWVIQALNDDMSYDQFVIRQLAGDLLPDRTQDDLVATGFLRNSMLNEEGGIDPEQFRMEAMFDRMDAIGKAVLGITIQCSQCHAHKYDPMTHAEYYQLFAFFNNSNESSINVYPGFQRQQRDEILASIRAIEGAARQENPDWREQLARWVDQVRGDQPEWTVLQLASANDNAQRYYFQPDGSCLVQGYAPTRLDAAFTATTPLPEIKAFRLELLPDPNLPAGGPGRAIDGLMALTEFWVETQQATEGAEKRKVKFVRATADFGNQHLQLGPKFADQKGVSRHTGPVEYAIDDNDDTAWGIDAGPGRRNVARQAVFVAEDNISFPEGANLTVHLSQKHGGWNSDDNQNMNVGRFRVAICADSNASADPLPREVRELVESARPIEQWTDDELDAAFAYWRTLQDGWSETNRKIEELWSRHPPGVTQLVLSERAQKRPTHRLDRGDFLKPQEEVAPGVPAFLPPLSAERPSRLDFARWLVDRRSPTAARAIVNRIWQAYFGVGLVQTSEDLGSQGSTPTHPELLDWLAVEFMEQGWSLKWLHRQIVSSATYRQSPRVTSEKLKVDPENHLLSRGSRFRLAAELVRDVALASSGLMTPQLGGPGVYPPAPEFLFVPPASYGPKTWNVDVGANRYRRSIYTFRFRSSPYPALTVFDAPSGDAACTRRSRSNTPLQALTTLNEPLFVECARALARMTLLEGGPSDRERLVFACRRCVTREPSEQDLQVLLAFLESTRRRLAEGDENQARDLAGETDAWPAGASAVEQAAWTATCRVILNLDETITRE